MKKTKKEKALNAWKRVYANGLKRRNLDRIQHDVDVCNRIHGKSVCGVYELWRFEQQIFHEVVIPLWKKAHSLTIETH